MTYASDTLYKDVIKKMMARLATIVKVREILPHLPCLTLTDQEEIDAKRETAGNYSAMILLLDCLRRRENWPEEFIIAMRACDHKTLANEISDAYDRIRGINTQKTTPVAAAGPSVAASLPPAPVPVTSNPAPAPAPAPAPVPSSVTTVTTATIHSAPSSTPILLTPSSLETPAQAAAPGTAQLSLESHPSTAASAPPEAPASFSAPEASVPPPPEPDQSAEPVPPVSVPHDRSPSPVSASKVTPSLEQNEVPFNSGTIPTLDSSDDLTLTDISERPTTIASCPPDNVETTSPFEHHTLSTSSQHPAASEESKIPLAIAESSTSVKHPIQDTNPPEKMTVLTQNSNINSVDQAQAASPGAAQATPSTSHDIVAGHLGHTAAENEDYFSKPGNLRGPEPTMESFDDLQISRHPTEAAGSSTVQSTRPLNQSIHLLPEEHLEEPCSITSDILMISGSNINVTTPSFAEQPPPEHAEVKVEPASVSHPIVDVNPIPHSTPEENSFSEGEATCPQNHPVEDHYESCQGLLEEPGTLVNIIQFSDEPSIQNLNGEPPKMTGSAVQQNDNPVSLKHSIQLEYGQSVLSDDPPSLQNQSITEFTPINEVHELEQTGPPAEAATSVKQASGLNALGLSKSREKRPKSEQCEETQGGLSQLQNDRRFIAAAAAFGMAAIFMAWKLKH